jgi:hypothetical protein
MNDRRGIALALAGIQFFFTIGWIVYGAFLPELLARAGLDKSWTPWVLAADQLVFALADLGVALAVDRARAAMARIGPLLVGLTAVATVAMLAMPLLAAFGAGPFLAVTLLWVASSAALRAPPYALLGRYAAVPEVPRLARASLLGMAAASAAGPYLGLALRGVDPLLAFAVSALAILAVSFGLVLAERRLGGAGESPLAAEPVAPLPFLSPAVLLLLLALLLATGGFQVQVAINAATQLRRFAEPAQMPYLLPIFWGGFAFGMLPAAWLGARLGFARTAGLALAAGGGGLVLAAGAASLAALCLGQALAGGAWGLLMASAIPLCTGFGRRGAEGRYAGLFFVMLAVGTLGRIVLGLAGLPAAAPVALAWLPVGLWAIAGLLLLPLARQERLRDRH